MLEPRHQLSHWSRLDFPILPSFDEFRHFQLMAETLSHVDARGPFGGVLQASFRPVETHDMLRIQNILAANSYQDIFMNIHTVQVGDGGLPFSDQAKRKEETHVGNTSHTAPCATRDAARARQTTKHRTTTRTIHTTCTTHISHHSTHHAPHFLRNTL